MTFSVKNNLLYKDGKRVFYKATPNVSGLIHPLYLVVHWTANDSYQGAINWLTNPTAKASAQLILSRDGEYAQLCELNRKAWHVGESFYNNLKGLNGYSIGIECVASGLLKKSPKGFINNLGKVIPVEDTITLSDGKTYQKLSDKQKQALYELCALLKQTYPTIKEVVSHKDLAIPRGRKKDCPDTWYGKEEINSFIK